MWEFDNGDEECGILFHLQMPHHGIGPLPTITHLALQLVRTPRKSTGL